MSGLPIFSGRGLARILGRIGYRVVRQRGSHMRSSATRRKSVTIPDYKTIDRSLLRNILRDAELSPEEFEKLRTSS